MLRAVCFDLMDTVLRDPFREALEAGTGVDLRTALAARDPRCWPEFEIAAIDEAEFARRYFADHPTLRFDLDAFHRARRAGYRFLPGMRELLDALAGKTERWIASNYPVWIEEVCVTFELRAPRIDGVVASHAIGVRKPDPSFYARLVEAVGHPAEACLFVDDRAANCEAAERAGMRAHVFDGVEGLRARLRDEGVL